MAQVHNRPANTAPSLESQPSAPEDGLSNKPNKKLVLWMAGLVMAASGVGTLVANQFSGRSDSKVSAPSNADGGEALPTAAPEIKPYVELSTNNPDIWLEDFLGNVRAFYWAETKAEKLEILAHITVDPLGEYEDWTNSDLWPVLIDSGAQISTTRIEENTDFNSNTERYIGYTMVDLNTGEAVMAPVFKLSPVITSMEDAASPEWLLDFSE